MRGFQRTILVTGASGFIGSHICDAALKRGDHVRTLTRRDWLGRPWVPVKDRYLGEFPFDLPPGSFEGVDGIVHLAGTTGGENEQTARAVNVEGTRCLLDLAQRHHVQKIVYLSSQSAHASAVSTYGKTKFEAEQLLLRGPVPVTILRPGLVYGEGHRGLFARIRRVAQRGPILPLIGGGKAILQPIHLDDLAEAIFKCLENGKYVGDVLSLGDPAGVTLADLLHMIAGPGPSYPKLTLPVPIAPVFHVVRALESRGIALPISTSNLQGLAHSERIDTEPDLRRLGLTLRPLSRGLAGIARRHRECGQSPDTMCLDARALKVVLVGAGRIGMIHAISIERQRGMRLAAVVDSNRRAMDFLRKIGIAVPEYLSLEQAIRAVQPDAVVIATPPSSHYPLVRAGVAAGLGVLVEKPLAASRAQLDEFAEATTGHPIQVGYFAPSFPHFRAALDRLRAGRFGRVQAFEAFCLLSYFPGTRRWETSRAHSAGGVLVNSGGHVFSMIHGVFGSPRFITAEHAKCSSKHVEDSVVAALDYGVFSGRVWSSWAIEGFPQPENRLVIFTDAGVLWCNSSASMFISRDRGLEWFSHQLDANVGFNVAPETVGAGIASELCQLQRMVRERARPTMSVVRAIEIDQMLFTIYERSKEVAQFSPHLTGPVQQPSEHVVLPHTRRRPPADGEGTTPIVLDVRRLRMVRFSSAIHDLAKRGDRFLARAAQARVLLAAGVPPQRLTVVVPDFVNHARILSSGRGLEFFKRLGFKPTLAFAAQAAYSMVPAMGLSLWSVAESMLAAELSWIPRDFEGTVLIDSSLTDLAVALDCAPRLDAQLRLIRARLASAKVGLQTNMLPDAVNHLIYLRQPLQAVYFLTSPHNARLERALLLLKSFPRLTQCELVAEVRSLPGSVHAIAAAAPRDWANGAHALAVDAISDPGLAPHIRDVLSDAWVRAFRGSVLPEAVL